MECDQYFCIYQENNTCSLREISIDEIGHCRDCIIINLGDDILHEEKRKLLEEYDSYD